MLKGHRATVLVALAVTESRPSQMSVGNVASVPPAASALITPAARATAKATDACHKVNATWTDGMAGDHGNIPTAGNLFLPEVGPLSRQSLVPLKRKEIDSRTAACIQSRLEDFPPCNIHLFLSIRLPNERPCCFL